MAYLLRLADLGEGVAEAEVTRWLVHVGQLVREDEPLVEVETAKATVEIPSPGDGRVVALHAGEGEVVAVGQALVEIELASSQVGELAEGPQPRGEEEANRRDGGEPTLPTRQLANSPTSNGAATPAPARKRAKALPAVRKLAVELGVDIDAIETDGAVTEADVRARAAALGEARDGAGETRVPVRGVRRAIAERLSRAHRETPAVTVVEECDFGALEERWRGYERIAATLRASALALAEFPALNATFTGPEIVLHERRDVGFAVETRAGLLVPVLRGVGEMSVADAGAEVRRLVRGARAGKLAPSELTGSTFTVTDAGRLGGLFATPLVNPPEVAIIGLHRVTDRPVVRDGEIVVRRMRFVSCTFDHRAVDGADAATFLLHYIELLEDPQRLEPAADPAPATA